MHSPENNSPQQLFDRAKKGLAQGIPFALYLKPGESELIGIFQGDDSLVRDEGFQGRGFLLAPFDLGRGMTLIRADAVMRSRFSQGRPGPLKKVDPPHGGEREHLELLGKALEELKSGRLIKVVLSKKWELPLQKGPIDIFKSLLQRYPAAFCHLVHHPGLGTWCGATPESLVRIKDREFRSMSLAGTLPFLEGENPNWGAKELEEQHMVTQYIVERLGPFMDRLEFGAQESRRAGQLWHLCSQIKGTLSAEADLGELVKSLHPTPAVGGIPKQQALDFILENENYDRTYYTGFLGEINLQAPRDISLFVNLRCMELKGDRALVFAGGGITSASDPYREWTEILNKSRTVLGAL